MKAEQIEDETTVKVPEPMIRPMIAPIPAPVTAFQGYFPITDLPSKCKLYPEGTEIYGRPLKVLEVKQLAMLNDDNSNQIINNILKAAVIGIDIDELLLSDKIYIVFWLRANTYKDPGYKINFNCFKCDTESTYEFGLECLSMTYISDDYDENAQIVLPESNDKMVLKFQRIKDVTEMDALKFKHRKQIKFDADLLKMAASISTINEEELSLKNRYDYLVNAHPGDYAYMKSVLDEYEIGLSPIIEVKCDSCGGTSPAGLSFRAEFFLPKHKH